MNTLRTNSTKFIMYALLSVGIVISILPFYWMMVGSTHPSGKILSVPPTFFFGDFLAENLASLNDSLGMIRIMGNSLLIALIYTLVSSLICAMAGYAFAKYRFKGQNFIFFFILCSLMIPYQVTLIPLFELMVNLNWLNTYHAVILPTLASPFAIYLMRQNMKSIPDSIIEAARVDGMGEIGIFFKIIMPTMRPL